jgi:DNA polymerase-4
MRRSSSATMRPSSVSQSQSAIRPNAASLPQRATRRDLRRQTLDFLQRNFGRAGSWYYEIARGQDDRPVQADRERKSSGSETAFSKDLIDPIQIEAGVIAMADDVWAWCEKANARGRTVTVKIKWADFQISTRSRSMETTVQTREKLHQFALGLIRSVFPLAKGIRLIGVTLSNFRSQPASEAAELPLS